MEKLIIDGEDIFAPINDKNFKQIIDCFVEYFGEEYRGVIETRLNDATFLFLGEVRKANSTKDSIQRYSSNKLIKILQDFNKKHGVYEDSATNLLFNKEISKHIFSDRQSLSLDDYEETALLSIAISVSNKDIIKDFNYNHIEFLDYVFKNEQDKLRAKFSAIQNDWEANYKEISDKYQKLNEVTSKIYDLKEKKVRKIQEDTERAEEELVKKILKQHNKQLNKSYLVKEEELKDYCDIYKDLIEKNPDFVTVYDKKKRMKLFAFLGIDKNKSYDECLKSEELRRIFEDESFKNAINKLREDEVENLFENCSYLKHAKEILEKNGYDLKHDIGTKKAIRNFVIGNDFESGFVRFSVTKDLKIKPVCVLPQRLELTNETLIHEMSHIITSNVFLKKIDAFSFKVEGRIGTEEVGGIRYGFLNEILNEIVAQEVSELAKKHSLKIGGREERSCYYTKGIDIVKPFFDKNKEEIKNILIEDEKDYFSTNFKEDFKELDVLLQKRYGAENISSGIEGLKNRLKESQKKEDTISQ